MSIVSTNVSYNYDILVSNIETLKNTYPFLYVGSIGSSVLGNSIFYIRIGNGNKEIFYNASFHANEWITTPVLMRFIEDFCISYSNNSNIYGYNARGIFESTSIYIVPMVNPDGVNLVTGNLAYNSNGYNYAKSIADNYPTIPFPNGWKSNIEGVDLNLQFPAGWENARRIKFEQGFTTPAPRDYVGHFPLSTLEAKAVYDFTLAHDFKLVIAYHTQGREIYWNFQNINPPRGYEIGRRFATSSGYSLTDVPYNSSFAGYKDWFIQHYNRPGFTIEAGLR